jgi:hypothetical protein
MRRHVRAARPRDLLTWGAIAYLILLGVVILPGSENARQRPHRLLFPDLSSVQPDLTVPPMTAGAPAPGRRVKQVNPEFRWKHVYYSLYLPTNWKKGKLYPVIVEYAGNGPGRDDANGDFSSGKLEDSNLGYGISGGKGFIWICMPFVNSKTGRNQTWWWGDPKATVKYCESAVRRVCKQYGGDSSRVILAGFSRGAIACNFIGLHDGTIADIWLAFIAYSHYDGVRQWDYEGSDRQSALERLRRLKGRASFICQERSVDNIRQYIESTGIVAPFTFVTIPFRNHNDAWALRRTPARKALRSWVKKVLKTRPGTHSLRGRVTAANGRPLSGVCIESGSHFTYTNRKGRFVLSGLIDSRRNVTASQEGRLFTPRAATVEIHDEDVTGLRFTASR